MTGADLGGIPVTGLRSAVYGVAASELSQNLKRLVMEGLPNGSFGFLRRLQRMRMRPTINMPSTPPTTPPATPPIFDL